MTKAFRLKPWEALYSISYANLMLLTATLPIYDSNTKYDRKGKGEVISTEKNDPQSKAKMMKLMADINNMW